MIVPTLTDQLQLCLYTGHKSTRWTTGIASYIPNRLRSSRVYYLGSGARDVGGTNLLPAHQIRLSDGGHYIDAGLGCNNPTKVLVTEAKSYYRMKRYKAMQPTCLVSIDTGQKDLIQLEKAAFVFWLKDRSGLSIARVLSQIATDCENTHDEVFSHHYENDTSDSYHRLNVPQGMQEIVLDEWRKTDDIKTYTDKYLRLSQTNKELQDCVDQLCKPPQNPSEIKKSQVKDVQQQLHTRPLQIEQGGSSFNGTNTVYGSQFQGNFAVFQRPFWR